MPDSPRCRIDCADALDFVRAIPDASVDLIVADPPYYRTVDADWDHRWPNASAFHAWLAPHLDEYRRVLRPNGSLYRFASPAQSARVEDAIGERLHVLSHIVWVKPTGRAHKVKKEALRSYFPASERIIFAEQFGADGSAMHKSGYAAACADARAFVFEPLRAYLDSERQRAGIAPQQCDRACGVATMASHHYFCRSQWQLPTAKHYAALQALFNAACNGSEPQYLRREYEDLRREYEYLRRPFAVTAADQYTDVWRFPIPTRRERVHQCQKPHAMMMQIVRASSRRGGVVFDPFVGSGSSAIAAMILGRDFIGCDSDEAMVQIAKDRVERARGPIFAPSRECEKTATPIV